MNFLSSELLSLKSFLVVKSRHLTGFGGIRAKLPLRIWGNGAIGLTYFKEKVRGRSGSLSLGKETGVFGLTDEDKLEWTLKVEFGELIIQVKPLKNK